MANLYENNSGGLISTWSAPSWNGNFNADFPYQTFTTRVPHTITSCRVHLKKVDSTSLSLWACSLFATDINGKPSGSVLASSLQTNPALADSTFDWQWVVFTFAAPLAVSTNTMYALRFHLNFASGDPKSVYWARSSNRYIGGQIWHFVWRQAPDTPVFPGDFEEGVGEGDHFFEIYGTGVPQPPSFLKTFPTDRPVGYDPDLTWQPGEWDGGDYTEGQFASDYQAAGGGRWNQQLVVTGNDRVYYEQRE